MNNRRKKPKPKPSTAPARQRSAATSSNVAGRGGTTELQHVEVSQQLWAGPLPHPDELERYERLIPGFSERAMAQWEGQSAHRQRMESAIVLGSVHAQSVGQRMAFVIGIVGLLVAGAVGIWGNAVAGVVVAALDLGTLVGAFVYGRSRQDAERRANEPPR